jgi:hypothetical protein
MTGPMISSSATDGTWLCVDRGLLMIRRECAGMTFRKPKWHIGLSV